VVGRQEEHVHLLLDRRLDVLNLIGRARGRGAGVHILPLGAAAKLANGFFEANVQGVEI